MSDVKDITPDLDKLDYQLDKLEDALSPLLKDLNERASQLPLLDKAKLFSLTAYAIESLLFCEFRLSRCVYFSLVLLFSLVGAVFLALWYAHRANQCVFAAYLRLQGADAQNHAVYAELKRVQQYFGKINAVEEPEGAGKRNVVVNQEAAARILKADLVCFFFRHSFEATFGLFSMLLSEIF